jgi:hypothetical protein
MSETYICYPENLKRGRRVSYEVEAEGDPECEHTLYHYELSSHGGIAFASFECGKCGRIIAQCIGEILIPERWGGER